MAWKTLEAGIRATIVASVACLALFASTPNVHGTADTRGGNPCDVNRTMQTVCGDTSYSNKCLYQYTSCYSVAGWRFMTCTLKPLANNSCEKDVGRCFPRDDYMPNGNCSPSYQAAAAVRVSQSQ
ncbi:MAG: hypothetical protein JSS49_09430 [Planctomycetes bacterium]|nr:hypothetical protein [Planctomycetota bacterium]